jgi:hypothetical protein
MFKTAWNNFKAFGKKAVGYVRGLNGDKAASFLTSYINNHNPGAAAVLSPFIQNLGTFINKHLDNIAETNKERSTGGIFKPVRTRLPQRRAAIVSNEV